MNSTNSEEDLYFEMEFDTKKEEEDVSSFSHKSVESLGTGSTVSGLSQEAEVVTRDERRGSSVGPILERPKYLRLDFLAPTGVHYTKLPIIFSSCNYIT